MLKTFIDYELQKLLALVSKEKVLAFEYQIAINNALMHAYIVRACGQISSDIIGAHNQVLEELFFSAYPEPTDQSQLSNTEIF